MADGLERCVVGRRLHEMAREHEYARHDNRHERAGLEGIEKARQVVCVRDEEAHRHNANDEQQRLLQPTPSRDL